MRARVLDRKEAMVLECAGRLTIRDRKSVERISNNITRSGHSQVVIDLSKLDYIDSGGLGILLSLRDGAVDRGKRVAISGAADSVREVWPPLLVVAANRIIGETASIAVVLQMNPRASVDGGAVWGEVVPQLTGANVSYVVRARVCLLRDLGAPLAPDNAWGIIQGLETAPLRMKQHCSNAEKAVDFLKKHKNVEKVIYPTLHEGEIAARSKKYLKGGNGALVGIELKGGVEAGKKFIESLKMFYHVANIGDARSLAIHPATTTHSQLTEEELLAAGVTPGYVRLSIGIEHPEDIIADLDQALNQSGKPNLKAVG